jgi:hypothetical protein
MAIESKPATEGTIKEIKAEVSEKVNKTDPRTGDIFSVRGKLPTDMEFCWLNTRKEMLEGDKFRGKYVVVNSQNAPGLETVCKQEGGTHQMGDAILAMRPKAIGEQERKELANRASNMRKGPKRDFERGTAEELAKHGIKKRLTFDDMQSE